MPRCDGVPKDPGPLLPLLALLVATGLPFIIASPALLAAFMLLVPAPKALVGTSRFMGVPGTDEALDDARDDMAVVAPV